jgi:hypothetical protein
MPVTSVKLVGTCHAWAQSHQAEMRSHGHLVGGYSLSAAGLRHRESLRSTKSESAKASRVPG